MRMKRPQGYKTKRCKHGDKVRFHFRTLHRLKLEIEWPPCCDPKGSVTEHSKHLTRQEEEEAALLGESGGRG